MKKILALLLAICTLLALCGCSKNSDGEEASATATIEGKGFKSAEKAILAYAQALQSGDVKEILSTFAMETYVENLDEEAYLASSGSYYTSSQGLFGSDAYSKEIRLVKRQYEITNLLSYIYLHHTGLDVSTPISVRDGYEDAGDLVGALVVEDWMDILAEMEIGRVVEAELLIPDQMLEGYRENLSKRADMFNCDELVSLAVQITLDGTDYYLCVDVACYDGKWYNLTHGGMLGSMLGGSYDTGLLVER